MDDSDYNLDKIIDYVYENENKKTIKKPLTYKELQNDINMIKHDRNISNLSVIINDIFTDVTLINNNLNNLELIRTNNDNNVLITIKPYENVENLDNIDYSVNNNNLNKLLVNSYLGDATILPIQNFDVSKDMLKKIKVLNGLTLINDNNYFSIEVSEYNNYINHKKLFDNVSENDLINIIEQIVNIYKLLNNNFKNKLFNIDLNDFKFYKIKNKYFVKLFNLSKIKLNKTADHEENYNFLSDIVSDLIKLSNNKKLGNNEKIKKIINSFNHNSNNIDMNGGGNVIRGNRKIKKYDNNSDDSDNSRKSYNSDSDSNISKSNKKKYKNKDNKKKYEKSKKERKKKQQDVESDNASESDSSLTSLSFDKDENDEYSQFKSNKIIHNQKKKIQQLKMIQKLKLY